MQIDALVTVTSFVNIRPEDLGGVRFADLAVGDLLYGSSMLVQITRKTPKRVYIAVIEEIGAQLALPGATNYMGNRPNLYVEEAGLRRYVTLPDAAAFHRLVGAYQKHAETIQELQNRLRSAVEERAKDVVVEIASAKGITLVEDKKS